MIKFLEKLLDFIFCRRCYLCKNSDENLLVCSKCFSKIPKNKLQKYVNDKTRIEFYASGIYKDELKLLIRGLKFHNQKEIAKYIAQFMYEYWKSLNIKNENYKIIAVPQYEKTKKPYNHAQEIAKEFAKLANYECDFDLIKRIKKTKPQYKLNYQERIKNLEGAFKLNKNIENDVTYIIIDDIITTSSTINQMQKTLNTDKNIVFCTSMSEVYIK